MQAFMKNLAGAVLLAVPAWALAAQPVVDVFKSASCGCCAAWIRHLESHGFQVKAHNVDNPSDYREKFGIPPRFGSCHSAKVGPYAIEGHVPASQIKRLIASGVKARGLAVPAMPRGSPGMEGEHSDAFDVLLIQSDGRASVYQHYRGKS